MANYNIHIEDLIKKEGGYRLSEHPNDRGGKTFAGISYRSNSDWSGWELLNQGKKDEAAALAVDLYKRRYWDALRLDQVRSEEVAAVLFSCCVLSGPRFAIRTAQRVAHSPADGLIGPNTITAINKVDSEKFILAYAIARIAHFKAICAKDRTQLVFLVGWINRVLRELE